MATIPDLNTLIAVHAFWGLTTVLVFWAALIGYTPEVFMGPLMGFLLDRTPGAIGHH